MIVLSDVVSATTADLLNSTRLQTVPRSGTMVFEFACDVATAASNFNVSVQLPNGDTPLEGVLVPASGTIGAIDDRTKLMFSVPVAQGGHVVVSFTRTGAAAVLAYRITFA